MSEAEDHPADVLSPVDEVRFDDGAEAVRLRLEPEQISERRICRVLVQARGSQRYQSKKVYKDRLLLGQMRRVVELHPRYGGERVHGLLNSSGLLGGWRVNYKRFHRLWNESTCKSRQNSGKSGGWSAAARVAASVIVRSNAIMFGATTS
jgi:hypothetical protein